MRLNKNNIVDVYLYPQTKEVYLGKAKLIQFKEYGLPYILEEDKKSGHFTVNFRNEKWLLEFITNNKYPIGFKKIFPIRTVYKVGNNAAKNTSKSNIFVDNNVIDLSYEILYDYFDDDGKYICSGGSGLPYKNFQPHQTEFWNNRLETQYPNQIY